MVFKVLAVPTQTLHTPRSWDRVLFPTSPWTSASCAMLLRGNGCGFWPLGWDHTFSKLTLLLDRIQVLKLIESYLPKPRGKKKDLKQILCHKLNDFFSQKNKLNEFKKYFVLFFISPKKHRWGKQEKGHTYVNIVSLKTLYENIFMGKLIKEKSSMRCEQS